MIRTTLRSAGCLAIGVAWLALGGCGQEEPQHSAEGLPQNESASPRSGGGGLDGEPDVGRTPRAEPEGQMPAGDGGEAPSD